MRSLNRNSLQVVLNARDLSLQPLFNIANTASAISGLASNFSGISSHTLVRKDKAEILSYKELLKSKSDYLTAISIQESSMVDINRIYLP